MQNKKKGKTRSGLFFTIPPLFFFFFSLKLVFLKSGFTHSPPGWQRLKFNKQKAKFASFLALESKQNHGIYLFTFAPTKGLPPAHRGKRQTAFNLLMGPPPPKLLEQKGLPQSKSFLVPASGGGPFLGSLFL